MPLYMTRPATGRTRKLDLGPWFFRVLRVMARLRFLRGTPFDFFGVAAHRRLERRLPREYAARLDELLDGLTKENLDLAVEIASLPEGIRGYDTIKERHLEEARVKERELLDAFRRRA